MIDADELAVLWVDNHLLVVAKPAGLPSVPDESGDPSALDLGREWVRRRFEKPGNVYLGVVHRLDRPVSGVLAFARTSKAAGRLAAAFRSRSVEKLYWGVALRAPGAEQGELEQWLVKDRERNVVRAVAHGTPQAKLARTRWRVLARAADGRTLLALVPETGRAHQLRVAVRSLGTSLAGDLKYGASTPLADASIALHARELVLDHPTSGERLRFEAEAPALPVWRFP